MNYDRSQTITLLDLAVLGSHYFRYVVKEVFKLGWLPPLAVVVNMGGQIDGERWIMVT